ncbi:hypothetical protein yc1106_07181 [Curvularia clavata]|uniref:Uncharacterized protein n=1 Tax=Curvularia clavata TaxID=95742 RepID=A0A9Q8ZD74_CURCL|nr:hypothetical protein yc1106_07181 [Curvularia clavata]
MFFARDIFDRIRGKTAPPHSESIKENAKPTVPSEERQHITMTSATNTSGSVDIDRDVEDVKNQLPPLPSPLPTPHKDFVHCVPPHAPTYRKFSVFTAGSIEMGNAVQWQKHMTALLSHLPITVCNPRRGHWNPNVTPLARDEDFRTQVEWELAALEQVDVICFFFDVMTKSPVSLLELGLWAGSGKVVVCCGDDYWKGGNVELTCRRYDIPFVKSFTELVPAVEKMLVEKGMVLNDKGDLAEENVHVDKEKPKKKAQLEAEKADLQKQIDELQAQLTKSRM